MKTRYEIGTIREVQILFHRLKNTELPYTFYYDETNNIRKFYIREQGFNDPEHANFVLGGLMHGKTISDINQLMKGLKLQQSVKEIKLKNLAKGDFIECLKSEKLAFFLKWLLDSDLFVHYSSINILYYSVVDIVDSAIANSEAAGQLGIQFANMLKNDLYKLVVLEEEAVLELFYHYEYPNVKTELLRDFIDDLVSLFQEYEDTQEFHFGLTSLKQILKQSAKANEMAFITHEEDYILLKDFSHFYLEKLYLFKNSEHILDIEESIKPIIDKFEIMDHGEVISNYQFVDSKSNRYIQFSDVFIGLVGKFFTFINTHSRDEINQVVSSLNKLQFDSLKAYFSLIDKSDQLNPALLHNLMSYEDMDKMRFLTNLVV